MFEEYHVMYDVEGLSWAPFVIRKGCWVIMDDNHSENIQLVILEYISSLLFFLFSLNCH